eukprot:CAMPEP_0180125478 /NCGR_PEP_ID=MMETSP0986-20121125/5208_1 /TAXON_ID=697907 /ORGANISM="non described non described, Strain CCMP2293" /LENGTH=61 /DNA_ID=CAMNT_0022064891 /DNA_START=65 /DNA_END=247 /DNA_ORIENTATION=+
MPYAASVFDARETGTLRRCCRIFVHAGFALPPPAVKTCSTLDAPMSASVAYASASTLEIEW